MFYQRYHLDHSSLLYQKPLLAKTMMMDVYNDCLLVTYHPFDVHIYHVKVSGDLTPSVIRIYSTRAIHHDCQMRRLKRLKPRIIILSWRKMFLKWRWMTMRLLVMPSHQLRFLLTLKY